MTRQTRSGFSFIELLIAVLLLSLSLLSFLYMNSMSSRSALDSRFELLVSTMSKEPIDVLRAYGYTWIRRNRNGPKWDELLKSLDVKDQDKYPVEASYFTREVKIDEGPDREGSPAFYAVTVTIAKSRQSFFSRPSASLKGLIWKNLH